VKACLLRAPAPVSTNPLAMADIPTPEPLGDQVLVRVKACGVCRTDLHIVEGELKPRKSPLVPGHQVVGVIQKMGPEAHRFPVGARVGIAWLHQTDGVCEYCSAGKENLCPQATFTGYTVDGGYAEYAVAPEAFVYPIPESFSDVDAAPLLCAGIIGFRALRLSAIQPGGRLGFYGFGAAAHVAIQVARHWGVEVYVFTRDTAHQRLALDLGAKSAGHSSGQYSNGGPRPPALDSAIIFAPAGELVPVALKVLKKGGTLVLAGIHMSTIPAMDYNLLYWERVVRSVANNTRQDGEDFLRVAAEIPIRTKVQTFPLAEANRALNALKSDEVSGAAVIQVAAS
jgi:propanol-preferring alcohol dehydrogenase